VLSAEPVKATTAKKTTAPKSTTTKAVKGAETVASTDPSAPSADKPQLNYWLIGLAAALAGGYALYEYRHDIAQFGRRVRDKLTNGHTR